MPWVTCSSSPPGVRLWTTTACHPAQGCSTSFLPCLFWHSVPVQWITERGLQILSESLGILNLYRLCTLQFPWYLHFKQYVELSQTNPFLVWKAVFCQGNTKPVQSTTELRIKDENAPQTTALLTAGMERDCWQAAMVRSQTLPAPSSSAESTQSLVIGKWVVSASWKWLWICKIDHLQITVFSSSLGSHELECMLARQKLRVGKSIAYRESSG